MSHRQALYFLALKNGGEKGTKNDSFVVSYNASVDKIVTGFLGPPAPFYEYSI